MSGPQQALLAAGGGAGVSLTNKTITGLDARASGTSTGTGTFTMKATGEALAVTVGNASSPPAGTTDYSPQWMLNGPSSLYEVKATLQAGNLSSGTTGSWLALSTDRSWSCTASSNLQGQVVVTATLLVEIRLAAGGTLLTGAGVTVVLKGEANSG